MKFVIDGVEQRFVRYPAGVTKRDYLHAVITTDALGATALVSDLSGVVSGSVTAPPTNPAPSYTVAPSASPTAATVGDNVTLTLGVWENGTPAGVLMQGGVDRTSEITDGVWSPGVSGVATWSVTATGPGGALAAPVVDITVEAEVVVDNNLAAGRISETYTGTPTAITGITNEGVGGWNLSITGTGSDVQRSARGFEFADGKYTQVAGLTTTGLGGIFLVLRGTLDSYGSGLQSLLEVNPTGALLQLRNNNGSMQAVYNTGSSVAVPLGSVEYGREFVIGIEVDNDAGYVRVSNIAGDLVQSTPAGTPLINYATVRSGQRVIGAISEWSIFTKPAGGAFAFSFEAVLADFTAG